MLNEYVENLVKKKERAAHFLASWGFDMVIQNGQRISTNRYVDEAKFSHVEYNEIFIGKLPRDLFEDELVPHLCRAGGTIIKIRHMMDISGSNRGFCFVKYTSVQEAIFAVRVLDNSMIRGNCQIGVKISFDNKCLFFGNLPSKCTEQQLIKSLQKVEITGIVRAKMADVPQSGRRTKQTLYPTFPQFPYYGNLHAYYGFPIEPPKPTCRYGYVWFDSHDSATRARRILMPSDIKIFNRKITLDWAKSEIPEIPELMEPQKLAPFIPRKLPFTPRNIPSLPKNTPPSIPKNDFFTKWSPQSSSSY